MHGADNLIALIDETKFERPSTVGAPVRDQVERALVGKQKILYSVPDDRGRS